MNQIEGVQAFELGTLSWYTYGKTDFLQGIEEKKEKILHQEEQTNHKTHKSPPFYRKKEYHSNEETQTRRKEFHSNEKFKNHSSRKY